MWSVVPVVVGATRASDGRVGLYRPRGTECWWPSHPKHEHPPFETVSQIPYEWDAEFSGMLTLLVPAADHCVSVMWERDGSFWGWYVDFVRPFRRTALGWDFADLQLDLVVRASGEIEVKDEHDLTEAVDRGEVTDAEAAAVRSSCDRLAAEAARRAGIFGEPWPEWRPDPAWPHPALSSAARRALRTPTPADAHPDPAWWVDEGRRPG